MISDVIRNSIRLHSLNINRSFFGHNLAKLVDGRPSTSIIVQTRSIKASIKGKLDFSKVPVIKEEELEEQFIHGGGPGGQAVNKAHNCVLLKHLPTGTVVKCHEFREAENNRVLAREKLKEKLDEIINGENSLINQIKRIEDSKRKTTESRKSKLRELKKQFKENLDKRTNNQEREE